MNKEQRTSRLAVCLFAVLLLCGCGGEKLPEDFAAVIEDEGVERAACDYISGMTDGYAMEKYGELFIPFAWTVK